MIKKCYKYIQKKYDNIFDESWIRKLNSIEKLIKSDNSLKKIKILIGPSFSVYPPSYALDRLLSVAFRMRGAEIIPIYCDGVQENECNYYGGDWLYGKEFGKHCKICQNKSISLWRGTKIKPIPLSVYLKISDINVIKSKVRLMDFEKALSHSENGIAYGVLAKDILVNSNLVATPTLVDDYEKLLKIHLQNLLIIGIAYEKILNDIKPDRVVSNDSYYGMWAIMEVLCKKMQIAFYSHWPITNHRVAFAYNDAAMNLDFNKPWEQYSLISLTNKDKDKIDKWLNGERGLIYDTTKLSGGLNFDPILKSINKEKPSLLIAANVIWDLAALNKQILFKDMNEWIIETIKWFDNQEEYQLLVKPHPIEKSNKIPKTRESVESVIELSGLKLPNNVFLLKADTELTLNNTINQFNIKGVIVHTSTVGFECPARGVHTITTARSPYRGFGFTIDPASKTEYFLCLYNVLSGKQANLTNNEVDLAKKYIKYYHFHYCVNTGLFSGNPPEISKDVLGLINKKDNALSYVIDSIIEGKSINDEVRWLPES